jgi:hypothetical protein
MLVLLTLCRSARHVRIEWNKAWSIKHIQSLNASVPALDTYLISPDHDLQQT